MALRKAFPKERKYEFWSIVMSFLIHQDSAISEKERTLFGLLSYRMLSKAAEAATSNVSSGQLSVAAKAYPPLGS